MVYSSLSSERYSENFTESNQPITHPRSTHKYLLQQKEQSKLNTPKSSDGDDDKKTGEIQ